MLKYEKMKLRFLLIFFVTLTFISLQYKLSLLKDLKKHLSERIPDDICKKVNGKLYICYNNIKKDKKRVKSHYKDVDEIINTINSDSENIDDAIIPGGSKLHKRTFKKILRNNKKRKTIKHKKSLK
jgi:seryl-tRNA synthetase